MGALTMKEGNYGMVKRDWLSTWFLDTVCELSKDENVFVGCAFCSQKLTPKKT